MGQAANSHRNASLDEKKLRAAGRNDGRKAIREAVDPPPAKGDTGGAFGAPGADTSEPKPKGSKQRG